MFCSLSSCLAHFITDVALYTATFQLIFVASEGFAQRALKMVQKVKKSLVRP